MSKNRTIPNPLSWSVVLLLLTFFGCGTSSPSSQAQAPQETTPSPETTTTPASEMTSPTQASPQAAPSASPNSSSAKESGRVYFANDRVSFVPPPGFTPMTEQEIALKFPGNNRPQHVYANDRRSVAVAITFSNANLTPEQLPELKAVMEEFLQKAKPDLKWVERDLITLNGIRWVKLESTTKAIDTDIHNDMYFTSFDGKMLGFNFNSTVEMYDKAKADLQKSRDSITIKS